MKKISDELREKVAEMSRNGMSYNQIKIETGLGKGTISAICQEINGKKEYVELTPEKINELQELYNQVGNIKAVASMSGVSYSRLREVLKLKKRVKLKSEYQCIKDARHKTKAELVAYKGGKCQVCGYDKCNEALEFHHIDPSTKSFALSSTNIYKNIDRLREEADKCVLVCSNCHREIHAGLINVQEYL